VLREGLRPFDSIDALAKIFKSLPGPGPAIFKGMAKLGRYPKTRFQRFCVLALLVCAGLYALVCAGCASFQRSLIYAPPKFRPEQADEVAKAEGLEPWNSPQGKRLGWMRLAPNQPAAGRVLILHGNASCAFQCGHYADAIQQAGSYDVFAVEYPGYAGQPGKPSEQSLGEAGSEALQLLSTNTPLYLVGESLGTGVAAYLAGRFPEKVAGVALLAPYNCLAAVGQAHVRILPVRLLLCDRFPAEDYLHNYGGPLAVLVGGHDTVVPERFGRRLYDSYAGPKRLWECPQATHDSLMSQPTSVWKQIIDFWQSHPG
jgi:uncharacterized protein